VVNITKALGLIEVRGKLGAILAADAAIKAANVILLGSEVIRGGLTTIYVIGDVAAVKAAIEAGEVAVANKNCLISSHVIPRLNDQVEKMLMKSFGKKEDNPLYLKDLNKSNIVETEIENILKEKNKKDVSLTTNESEEIFQEDLEHGVDSIVDSSFDKEGLDNSTLEKSDIQFANKAGFIEALLDKGVEN